MKYFLNPVSSVPSWLICCALLAALSGCRSAPKGLSSRSEDATRSPARPSSGCQPKKAAEGELVLDVLGHQGRYFVSVPRVYDGNRPFPLVFAFHGRQRSHTDCRLSDCQGFFEEMHEHAVLVFMKSFGAGWERDGERVTNLAFFDRALAHVKSSYCIDESRIFAAGASSGGHFTNLLACRNGDVLRAVAPIAGALQQRQGCTGTPPALVIHGVRDNLVPFREGELAREFYRTRNRCSESTITPLPGLHARVTDDPEGHECTEYRGCASGGAVAWCEHNEGGYDGSTHGVPKFAGKAVWTFFDRF